MFMETSAKAGHNVKSLFKKIALSLPGMEKDAVEAPNTSTLSFPLFLLKSMIAVAPEIDVTSQPAAELPEASACNC